MNTITSQFGKIEASETKKHYRRVSFKPFLLLLAFLPLVWTASLFIIIISQETPGFRVEVTQDCFIVSHIDKDLNAISENDRITHVFGTAYPDILSIEAMFQRGALTQNQLTVQKNGISKITTYITEPITVVDFFKGAWLQVLWVVITTFLAVAALLKAPPEQPADLFLVTYTFFSLTIINEIPCHFGLLNPWLMSFSFWSVAVFHWLAFSSWVHFVFQFPVGRQFLTGRTTLIAAIYFLPPAIAIGLSYTVSGNSGNFTGLLQHYRYWATPWIIATTFLKHFIDYWKIRPSLEGSQLKLLLFGGFAGIAPYFFLYLFPNILFNRPLINFSAVLLFGLLLPVSIFFAIIRYKLMDVDEIISKGATYFILIVSLIFAYSGFLVGVKKWVWGDGLFTGEIFLVFIVFVALVFNPIKNRLQSIIDRIFLRDPLDYGKLMQALSNRIAKSIKLPDIVEIVTEKFPRENRIQKSFILIADDKSLRLYPETSSLSLTLDALALLTDAMRNSKKHLCAYEIDHSKPGQAEILDQMESIECPVAYRLESSKGFLGVLFLGNKLNGKLYSRAEIQVFATLANTTSIAIENALMYESLKESKNQIQQMFNKVTQAEKLAAIGEMTAVLAHEIRNPLAIIRSSIEFLIDKKREAHIQEELLSNVLQEIDTLNIFVNNTLGLARYKAPECTRIDISKMIRNLVKKWTGSSEHNPKVEFQFYEDTIVPLVSADEKQLSQVFLNLFLNAEDAMPDGGEIKIEIYDTPQDNGITIRFKDTGTGISPEQEKNVFKKFYTSKPGGLGLGLVVCEQIIHAHNGTISLKNRKNKGAAVTVCLQYQAYEKMQDS